MTICAYDSVFVLEQDGEAAEVYLSMREAMNAGADGANASTSITQFRGVDAVDRRMRPTRIWEWCGPGIAGAYGNWMRIDKAQRRSA